MTDLVEKVQANTGASKNKGGNTYPQLIEQLATEFDKAIPKGVPVDGIEFARVATTLFRTTPALMQCTWASLAGCMMSVAQLGLSLDPQRKEAYLVPYKDQATLIIGYRGYMELALRSGEVTKIVARIVYENDEFDVEFGDHERIVHRPARLGSEKGEPVGVYATAFFAADVSPTSVVLDVAEVEEYRARSRASGKGPWVTDWEAMAKKTAVRRLEPWLPSSVAELGKAVAIEDSGGVSVTAPRVPELPVVVADVGPVDEGDSDEAVST